MDQLLVIALTLYTRPGCHLCQDMKVIVERVVRNTRTAARIEEIDIDALRTGKPAGVGGAFGELDVQPLCDWGLFAQGSVEKPTNNDDGYGALQFGVFFEPNSRCRVERGTKLGLHTPPP